MITEDQKERRKKGIFASDAAKILTGQGVKVTLEKMGEIEPDNLDGIASVELGNILEKPVLDAYEKAAEPLQLIRSPDTILHPIYEWFGCHLDGLATFQDDRSIVVEAKAFSAFNRDGWGDPGTDEVPLDRMWQVMAQMACTGATQADIPITFVNEKVLAQFLTSGTVPIEIYVIKRDEELIEYMIAECKKVWDCVTEGRLPDPVNVGDAELIWRRNSPNKIFNAPDEVARLWDELRFARAELDRAENAKLIAEAKFKNVMQDAAEVRWNGKTLATWKSAKDGTKFDDVAFELAHPDLYAQFLKARPGSRRFLVKDA